MNQSLSHIEGSWAKEDYIVKVQGLGMLKFPYLTGWPLALGIAAAHAESESYKRRQISVEKERILLHFQAVRYLRSHFPTISKGGIDSHARLVTRKAALIAPSCSSGLADYTRINR